MQVDHRVNYSPVRFDSSHQPPVTSQPSLPSASSQLFLFPTIQAIREVQMFSENGDIFNTYINNCYLYPLKVRGIKQKHIKVLVKVKDLGNNADLNGPGNFIAYHTILQFFCSIFEYPFFRTSDCLWYAAGIQICGAREHVLLRRKRNFFQ
jgi:hypothetical protein